jgi:hypothetical protein
MWRRISVIVASAELAVVTHTLGDGDGPGRLVHAA